MADLIIADDEPEILTLLERLLSLQHNVRVAGNGMEALQLVREQKPDLALLDYHMPHMNGAELAKQFNHHAVPFMFITGESEWEVIQEIISLGALAYLLKPFDPMKCIPTVEEALRLAGERRVLQRSAAR